MSALMLYNQSKKYTPADLFLSLQDMSVLWVVSLMIGKHVMAEFNAGL